ncbi:DUF2947 family protein [Marinomonas algarum]|uniref:DUF2947 domain-containing protein n=1 Tax=Marinomonas algarum TaxID=2883105 RepID=A0A9X1IQN0_9GAMM|nr:DUF2947 family protein [Marinomonas algarum]MCB5162188.1 DUF2947 domain-containing protein [Marinomonas algarum]
MYQSIETFSKRWIFKREDPKVDAEDFAQIHLLTESAAEQIWRDYISVDQLHPDHFTIQDWPKKEAAQVIEGKLSWEKAWDSSESNLPDGFLAHFETWGDDTKVYFCCHSGLVFEVTWGVFKRTWKAFLFLDNGPVLVGRKKKQAAQFHSSGWANLLYRVF